MDWKNRTEEEYDAAKDELIERVILHLRSPDEYDCPRLTQDEISILISEDKDHVLSKMTICKDEAKAMAKMRRGLAKMGVRTLEEICNISKGRSCAEPVRLS